MGHPEAAQRHAKKSRERRAAKIQFAKQAEQTLAEKEEELAEAEQRALDLRRQIDAEKKKLAELEKQLAKADRVLASRGGRKPEDERGARVDALYNQRKKWEDIQKQIETEFGVRTTIKALQSLRDRHLKRQKPSKP